MGLGSTAKKLQTLVDTAEELYNRVNDLRDRVVRMESTVDETNQRVGDLEADVREVRALVEAVAEDQGVDVDAVLEEVDRGAAKATSEAAAGDDNS
ncbi:MAG: DUF5798 family protein [Halobacteriaceae archaeon]